MTIKEYYQPKFGRKIQILNLDQMNNITKLYPIENLNLLIKYILKKRMYYQR